MLKIYLQLRNALLKFLNMKSITVLKMETKNLIKIGLCHICFMTMVFALFFLDSKFRQDK